MTEQAMAQQEAGMAHTDWSYYRGDDGRMIGWPERCIHEDDPQHRCNGGDYCEVQ